MAIRPKAGQAFIEANPEWTDTGFFAALSEGLKELAPQIVRSLADWEDTYGQPYPQTDEDWVRLLVRAGVSPEAAVHGHYAPEHYVAIIEGYLQRLRDQRQKASQLPSHEATKTGGHADTSSGQKRKLPPRKMNDSARACIRAFKGRINRGESIKMKQHCREYAVDKGDSFTSLYHTITDNPTEWKDATERTK